MNYYKMNLDYIINWCEENKQVAWLKAKAAEEIKEKAEDGTITTRKISFIELKRDFCLEFMADIVPVAAENKKVSMYDRIANL